MTKQSNDFPSAAKAYVEAKRALAGLPQANRGQADRLVSAYERAVHGLCRAADAVGSELITQEQEVARERATG